MGDVGDRGGSQAGEDPEGGGDKLLRWVRGQQAQARGTHCRGCLGILPHVL